MKIFKDINDIKACIMIASAKQMVFKNIKDIVLIHSDRMDIIADDNYNFCVSFPRDTSENVTTIFARVEYVEYAIKVFMPAFMEDRKILPVSIFKAISKNFDSDGVLWVYRENTAIYDSIDKALEFYKSNWWIIKLFKMKNNSSL